MVHILFLSELPLEETSVLHLSYYQNHKNHQAQSTKVTETKYLDLFKYVIILVWISSFLFEFSFIMSDFFYFVAEKNMNETETFNISFSIVFADASCHLQRKIMLLENTLFILYCMYLPYELRVGQDILTEGWMTRIRPWVESGCRFSLTPSRPDLFWCSSIFL